MIHRRLACVGRHYTSVLTTWVGLGSVGGHHRLQLGALGGRLVGVGGLLHLHHGEGHGGRGEGRVGGGGAHRGGHHHTPAARWGEEVMERESKVR